MFPDAIFLVLVLSQWFMAAWSIVGAILYLRLFEAGRTCSREFVNAICGFFPPLSSSNCRECCTTPNTSSELGSFPTYMSWGRVGVPNKGHEGNRRRATVGVQGGSNALTRLARFLLKEAAALGLIGFRAAEIGVDTPALSRRPRTCSAAHVQSR